MTVRVQCHMCRQHVSVEVEQTKFEQWKSGKGFIQDLLPELSPEDRELLISRTCGPCFSKLFREPES